MGAAMKKFFLQGREAHGAVSSGLMEAFIFTFPPEVYQDYFTITRSGQDEFFQRCRKFFGLITGDHFWSRSVRSPAKLGPQGATRPCSPCSWQAALLSMLKVKLVQKEKPVLLFKGAKEWKISKEITQAATQPKTAG